VSGLLHLAAVFAKIGLFTLGGGLAMLPLIRGEMLARGWLSEAEFLDILAVAEMTPGPMAVNTATFVGYRLGGLAGALAATLALAAPSLLIVCAFGALWRRHRDDPAGRRVLALLRPTIAGLVLAAALGLCAACILTGGAGGEGSGRGDFDAVGLVVCAGVFAATWRYRVNPLLGLACGGLAGFALRALAP